MDTKIQSIFKSAVADLAIAFLILIIFGKALSFGMIWDDQIFIKEPFNSGIVQSGIQSFSHGYINISADNQSEVYYRPITSFLFKIENYFFKGEAFGYHLVNIIIHLINALLLRRLGMLITGSRQIAFIAAVFFAVYPLNVESVVWISGRTDLLATCFILSALLCHIRYVVRENYRETKFPLCVLLFFICACLSKETGYILLFLLPTSGLLLSKAKILVHFYNFKKTYISIIIASIGLIMLRLIVIPQGFQGLWFYPDPFIWILSAVSAFSKYMIKIFYPFDAEPYIINPYVESCLNIYFIVGLFLIIGSVLIFYFWLKTKREVSFAVLFIFFTLLPAMNVLRVGSPMDMGFTMADRFCYLPFCGAALLTAWLLKTLLGSKNENETSKRFLFFIPKNKRLMLLCLILIMLMGTVNFISSNKYKNDETFYIAALRRNPQSRLLRMNLAVNYWKNREYEKAYRQINELKRNLSLEDADILNIEGVLLFNLKKPAEAIDRFSKAISLNQNNQFLWHNFGILYLNLGLQDQAIEYLESSLKKNPHFTDSKIALAIAYQKDGKKDEAAKIYEEMLLVHPNNPGILTNYGSLLFELDEVKRGQKFLEQALILNPNNAIILYNYARCLVLYTDQLDKAKDAAERIMQINPSFPALYLLMGEIYSQKKEYNRALRWIYAGLSLQNIDEEMKDSLKIKITEIYEILGIKR